MGPVKAQAIIDYRAQHGPFSSPQDLIKVKGIGQITLDKNLSRLRTE
ncbi:MAG: helix-hairpin-helix domain-containing protein [Candidatus Cloacimonadaceae bacterium]